MVILSLTLVPLSIMSKKSFRTVKSKELDEERRQNGMVLLRTQLFEWLSHLLLCFFCVTCMLWKWRKKSNGHQQTSLKALLWWLESKRWKGRLDNQKAGSCCWPNYWPNYICLLISHLTWDWVHWGTGWREAGVTWGPAPRSQPAPPGSGGLTGTWIRTLRDVYNPVSAAPLWHSWTLKCSCKHTDCGSGESYLGIRVSSEFLSIQSLCHLAIFLFGKRQLQNWNQISDCSLLLCWDCEYREKKEREKNLDFFGGIMGKGNR